MKEFRNIIVDVETGDLEGLCKSSQDGLVFQGCGGPVEEWVDGVNDMLTDRGILLNGYKFDEVYRFKDGDVTCLMFPLGGADLAIGKLALWRIETYEVFGAMWLSDYLDNMKGGDNWTESF